MLSYTKFKKHLNNIKKLRDLNYKTAEFSRKLDKNSYGIYIFDKAIDDLVELLTDVMDDKYKYIDYYIYEIDWGKKGKDCITFASGEKVSLYTVRQLYDFIIENNEDE